MKQSMRRSIHEPTIQVCCLLGLRHRAHFAATRVPLRHTGCCTSTFGSVSSAVKQPSAICATEPESASTHWCPAWGVGGSSPQYCVDAAIAKLFRKTHILSLPPLV